MPRPASFLERFQLAARAEGLLGAVAGGRHADHPYRHGGDRAGQAEGKRLALLEWRGRWPSWADIRQGRRPSPTGARGVLNLDLGLAAARVEPAAVVEVLAVLEDHTAESAQAGERHRVPVFLGRLPSNVTTKLAGSPSMIEPI